jgi:antitoxin HicB
MAQAADYRVYVEPLAAHLGGGFVAYAPELNGCLADGETPSEALAAIYDAIQCWIEGAIEAGRRIPAPSHITMKLSA